MHIDIHNVNLKCSFMIFMLAKTHEDKPLLGSIWLSKESPHAGCQMEKISQHHQNPSAMCLVFRPSNVFSRSFQGKGIRISQNFQFCSSRVLIRLKLLGTVIIRVMPLVTCDTLPRRAPMSRWIIMMRCAGTLPVSKPWG